MRGRRDVVFAQLGRQGGMVWMAYVLFPFVINHGIGKELVIGPIIIRED